MQREYTERKECNFLSPCKRVNSLLTLAWVYILHEWKTLSLSLLLMLNIFNCTATHSNSNQINKSREHKSVERREKCATREAQFALFASRCTHTRTATRIDANEIFLWSSLCVNCHTFGDTYLWHNLTSAQRKREKERDEEEGRKKRKTWQMLHFATKCPSVIAFWPISVWTFDGSGVWMVFFFFKS